tara:strand:+ start:2137 stop:4095 length:1959 start_codon:yes stop_codon:yes gene_type:complete
MTTSRAAAEIRVYVDGKLDTSLRPLVIEQTIGGENLDYAVLESDINRQFRNIEGQTGDDSLPTTDAELIESQKEIIEISIDQTIGGERDRFVHFGQISQVKPILNEGGEGVRYISRTERFHFGKPLTTIRVHSPPSGRLGGGHPPGSGSTIDVDWDMIFNPIVDGKVTGSRSPHKDGERGGSFPFVNPDAVVAETEKHLQGGEAKLWDLMEAVYAVCHTLNTGPHITNPIRADLANLFSPHDLLHNVRIKPGQYLPDILAKLVEPFGYSWHLERSLGKRTIKFFRKGITGKAASLKLQARGETVDVTKSNVKKFNVVFDKTQLANQVTVIGAPIRAEFTAELHRGWESHLDGLSLAQLSNKEHELYPERKNVYRKYVLNESGAYNGLRASITSAFSWGDVFKTTEIAGKRKPLATLTLHSETMRSYGDIDGVFVEWTDGREFDPNDRRTGHMPSWVDASKEGCQLLQDEIGVYFSSDMPPDELHGYLGARVRITCTVESDHKVKFTAKRRKTSKQPNIAELVLSASKSYQHNYIVTEGKNKSVLAVKNNPTLERDDRAALGKYAERVRESVDAAKGKGNIVLEGIDQGAYTLGKTIDRIEGIGLGLQMNKGVVPAVYPFIAALRFDIDKQETTITIDQLRKTPRNADRKVRD